MDYEEECELDVDLVKNFVEKLIDKVTYIDPINNIDEDMVAFEFEQKRSIIVKFGFNKCFAKLLPSSKPAYDEVFVTKNLNELHTRVYGC